MSCLIYSLLVLIFLKPYPSRQKIDGKKFAFEPCDTPVHKPKLNRRKNGLSQSFAFSAPREICFGSSWIIISSIPRFFLRVGCKFKCAWLMKRVESFSPSSKVPLLCGRWINYIYLSWASRKSAADVLRGPIPMQIKPWLKALCFSARQDIFPSTFTPANPHSDFSN